MMPKITCAADIDPECTESASIRNHHPEKNCAGKSKEKFKMSISEWANLFVVQTNDALIQFGQHHVGSFYIKN